MRFLLLTATWWTAAGMMERGGPGSVALVPGPCSVPCAPRASAVSLLGGKWGRGRAREWPRAKYVTMMRVREEESALASRGYKIWYSVSKRLCQRSPTPACIVCMCACACSYIFGAVVCVCKCTTCVCAAFALVCVWLFV